MRRDVATRAYPQLSHRLGGLRLSRSALAARDTHRTPASLVASTRSRYCLYWWIQWLVVIDLDGWSCIWRHFSIYGLCQDLVGCISENVPFTFCICHGANLTFFHRVQELDRRNIFYCMVPSGIVRYGMLVWLTMYWGSQKRRGLTIKGQRSTISNLDSSSLLPFILGSTRISIDILLLKWTWQQNLDKWTLSLSHEVL